MNTVFIFKSKNTLSNDDAGELRAELKRQIGEGLLLLDAKTEYIETVALQESLIKINLSTTPPETESAFNIVRRSRSEASLAEIKAAIKSGHGRDIIRPFDELEFKLDTGEDVTAVCGGYITPTRARFVFKDCLAETGQMNKDATNKGGYYKSKGRKHILEDIYPHLPPELREIIEPRPLVETIDGETVEYSDPLWIPSGTDVFGTRKNWYTEEPDSVQLDIFKQERDRVKETKGYGTAYWWLRSPGASCSTNFVFVSADGTVHYTRAYFSLGFAPGFDL